MNWEARGTKLIPALQDGLKRAWIPRWQIVGLHAKLESLVAALDLTPLPIAPISEIGEQVVMDYLWVCPPVIIPKVRDGEEIAEYRCIAGIEAFRMLALLPSAALVHVLRAPRRTDHDRMVPAAIAEMRIAQYRARHDPLWRPAADRNLNRLDKALRGFEKERSRDAALEVTRASDELSAGPTGPAGSERD
ncbi:MAG: hypothetical protein Q8L99_00705 [Polycyclovorans sp.]|jgi:hypothetical protein|nr:hypothetical protein [Polycyclovorans sp.]|tara:strand:+ start:5376 stop:5948 length:573 start_codon:yes stop_codon:yes gene_type:complete